MRISLNVRHWYISATGSASFESRLRPHSGTARRSLRGGDAGAARRAAGPALEGAREGGRVGVSQQARRLLGAHRALLQPAERVRLADLLQDVAQAVALIVEPPPQRTLADAHLDGDVAGPRAA